MARSCGGNTAFHYPASRPSGSARHGMRGLKSPRASWARPVWRMTPRRAKPISRSCSSRWASCPAAPAPPPLRVATTGAPQDPPQETDPPAGTATAGGPSAADPATQLPLTSKTFNLLMGVELAVSVSFGRVQLPLKDVLKLTAGSIIELNRTVDEPVEVIVNNCVVARGEVVVVEGNYGVRIDHIMSRQERLEALP